MGGLIAKPVTGILDSVSKAAEGVQNSAKKDKILNLSRIRPPRAFYQRELTLRPYKSDDAVFYNSLKSVKNREDQLIAGYSELKDISSSKAVYLAITNKCLTVVDSDSIMRQIDLKYISKIYRPEIDQVAIEYRTSQRQNLSMRFNVTEGAYATEQIVADIHMQIGQVMRML